ncbi:MAG TPA: putative DNA modification/repair radical SAM protein [Chloroflexi bacterium]|nr:putative DNA modification/repair radical SAM protein [Chloroflexota bacterium]
MNAIDRLRLLSSQMHLEPAEDAQCPEISTRKKDEVYISSAALPNGQRISMLKTLLTSACERNCYYCPFRAGRDFRRATFHPDEFARLFMYLHKAGAAQGIFLSSGVFNGGMHTQDQLLATAEILRHSYQYRGYLHLKIMPGAEKEQVLQAMRLADRVSVNLEAPNDARLQKLAPKKHFMEELMQPLRWANEIRREESPQLTWKGRWASTVTQFVVGAVGDTDVEILSTTENLHRQNGLARAYFSAFNPISDTPLENHAPTPLIRQNRLYQASFLLRDYGFTLEDLPFAGEGNLPLETDPKTAWAQTHLQQHPLEINHASREELLRIPGIGPKGVEIILAARRERRLCDLSVLGKLGVLAQRAAPYILLDGKRPERQLVFAGW